MTSRREFLAGFVAFAAMRSLPTDAATLEYYDKYLDAIARKIKTNAESKGANGGFFFYADSHVVSNHGQSGFVMADECCETDVPGLFVAGDCRKKAVRQLTTAASDGACAGIAAAKYIESL